MTAFLSAVMQCVLFIYGGGGIELDVKYMCECLRLNWKKCWPWCEGTFVSLWPSYSRWVAKVREMTILSCRSQY